MYNKLNYWLKTNEKANINCIDIPFNCIKITEDIHKDGSFDKTRFNKYTHILPIVVRQLDDTTYGLIANWSAYKYYESCNAPNKKVKCILVQDNRDNFFEAINAMDIPENFISKKNIKVNVIEIRLNKIKILNDFKKTPPKEYKIQDAIQNYKIKGKFDKPITINKDKVLIDGYARYLAAVSLGLKQVEVIQRMN